MFTEKKEISFLKKKEWVFFSGFAWVFWYIFVMDRLLPKFHIFIQDYIFGVDSFLLITHFPSMMEWGDYSLLNLVIILLGVVVILENGDVSKKTKTLVQVVDFSIFIFAGVCGVRGWEGCVDGRGCRSKGKTVLLSIKYTTRKKM